MNILTKIADKFKYIKRGFGAGDDRAVHEFCPRCDAIITMQKGYSNTLPYWQCQGCGEILINPSVETEDNIVWICDKCEAMLNIQPGFTTGCREWWCTQCGYINKIDKADIYVSDGEYQVNRSNPYRGMSDADVLEIMEYEELENIDDRDDIILVQNSDGDEIYIKKILRDYDASIYRHLMKNPVAHMPKIIGVYEGEESLVIIEEYIEGETLEEILEDEEKLDFEFAIDVAKGIAKILCELHNQEKPVVHRDVKPSNVMVSSSGEVYLLDINVAKWYEPEKTEDTRLFGTLYYAAPEQLGYGFTSSSDRSDIYALGIMLNVMLTGKKPKEERAAGGIWNVIERCISLEPSKRYSAEELLEVLECY